MVTGVGGDPSDDFAELPPEVRPLATKLSASLTERLVPQVTSIVEGALRRERQAALVLLLLGVLAGGTVGWMAARTVGSDVPAWPGVALSAGSVFTSGLYVFWRSDHDRWSRNVRMLQDNVLVLIVGTLVSLAFGILIGQAID